MLRKKLLKTVSALGLVFVAGPALATSGTTVTKDSVYQSSSPLESNAGSLLDVRFISPFKARDTRDDGTPQYVQIKSDFKPANLSVIFNPNSKDGSALMSVLNHRITDVLDRTHLCDGTDDAGVASKSGSGFGTDTFDNAFERLKYCARFHPDEFSAASNIIQPYIEWRQSEVQGIMSMYEAKLNSPNMADRIEGRYIVSCVMKHYGEVRDDTGNSGSGETAERRDISTALSYCADPKNWDFTDMFPKLDMASCMDQSSASGTPNSTTNTNNDPNLLYVFDSHEFLSNCVANKYTAIVDSNEKLSEGLQVAIGMLPYTRFEIYKKEDGNKTYAEIKVKTYPMAMSAQQLYDTLYLRNESILMKNSNGCIPSPFIPKDVFEEAVNNASSEADWKKYCSILIPAGVTEKIKETGAEMAPFFWSRVAKKVAQIQTLELLNGSTLVAQEGYRILNASDNELGFLTAGTAEIMRIATQTYKSSIDLAISTKLEDVLNGAEDFIKKSGDVNKRAQESYHLTLQKGRNRLANAVGTPL